MNASDFTTATDRTAEFEQRDIEDNRVMGILSYISWLVLIPIFAAPNSKFARFNANQGLVLAICEIILGVVGSILGCIPFIGWLFALPCWLLDVCAVILTVLGIVNSARGRAVSLPVIGKFTILK